MVSIKLWLLSSRSGVPAPGPQTGPGPWPVGNQASQQEVSGGSAASHSPAPASPPQLHLGSSSMRFSGAPAPDATKVGGRCSRPRGQRACRRWGLSTQSAVHELPGLGLPADPVIPTPNKETEGQREAVSALAQGVAEAVYRLCMGESRLPVPALGCFQARRRGKRTENRRQSGRQSALLRWRCRGRLGEVGDQG